MVGPCVMRSRRESKRRSNMPTASRNDGQHGGAAVDAGAVQLQSGILGEVRLEDGPVVAGVGGLEGRRRRRENARSSGGVVLSFMGHGVSLSSSFADTPVIGSRTSFQFKQIHEIQFRCSSSRSTGADRSIVSSTARSVGAILGGRACGRARVFRSDARRRETSTGVAQESRRVGVCGQLVDEGTRSTRVGSGTYVASELPGPERVVRPRLRRRRRIRSPPATVAGRAASRRARRRVDDDSSLGLRCDFSCGRPSWRDFPRGLGPTRGGAGRDPRAPPTSTIAAVRRSAGATGRDRRASGRWRGLACSGRAGDCHQRITAGASSSSPGPPARSRRHGGARRAALRGGRGRHSRAARARSRADPRRRAGPRRRAPRVGTASPACRLRDARPSVPDRRRAAARAPPGVARRGRAAQDAYVIEDDYDSEYRYAGAPIETLHGLDRGRPRVPRRQLLEDPPRRRSGSDTSSCPPGVQRGDVRAARSIAAAGNLVGRSFRLQRVLMWNFNIAGGHLEVHLRRSRRRHREEAPARAATAGGDVADILGDQVESAGRGPPAPPRHALVPRRSRRQARRRAHGPVRRRPRRRDLTDDRPSISRRPRAGRPCPCSATARGLRARDHATGIARLRRRFIGVALLAVPVAPGRSPRARCATAQIAEAPLVRVGRQKSRRWRVLDAHSGGVEQQSSGRLPSHGGGARRAGDGSPAAERRGRDHARRGAWLVAVAEGRRGEISPQGAMGVLVEASTRRHAPTLARESKNLRGLSDHRGRRRALGGRSVAARGRSGRLGEAHRAVLKSSARSRGTASSLTGEMEIDGSAGRCAGLLGARPPIPRAAPEAVATARSSAGRRRGSTPLGVASATRQCGRAGSGGISALH